MKGKIREQDLEYSKHTKIAIRKLFTAHRLIHVEDIAAGGAGLGGRPRKQWVIEISGVILALKNDLVTPQQVSTTVKDTFFNWLEKGLRIVKKRKARVAFRKIAEIVLNSVGKDPDVCSLLMGFDFEFCSPVVVLIPLMHIAYLSKVSGMSEREKKRMKKHYDIAVKELDDLLDIVGKSSFK